VLPWRRSSGSFPAAERVPTLATYLPTRSVAPAVVLLLSATPTMAGSARPESDPEAVAAGKRIYREGILPSGQPIVAMVQGDVPLSGSTVACVNCHRRAGMGAIEANRVVVPVSGGELFSPRDTGYRPRPAYTDESLAVALREGVDPAGQPIDPLMPVYDVSDGDLRQLIAYLRTLSVEYSPGVTDEEIRFATVVAGGVEAASVEAMLDTLNAFFDEKNRRTRHEVSRLQRGPFFRDYKYKAYRHWTLDAWTFEGPPESWREQLERRYRERPVFALVGGLAVGSWEPIHRFCEDRELPSLLPNTDLPALEENAYYTLYYSQGLALEARVLARQLAASGHPRVLQAYRPDSPGAAAARALEDAWRAGSGDAELLEWPMVPSSPLRRGLEDEVRRTGASVVVLWLGRGDLAGLREWAPTPDLRVYLSSTLLGGSFAEVPTALTRQALGLHPFTRPAEAERRSMRIRGWLRSRGIEGPHFRIRAQSYFACMLVGDALARIKRYFFRDYLMDSLEHADRMAAYSASYPRLSFGPGQRYLSKGAYVVPLSDDSGWERAEWVIP